MLSPKPDVESSLNRVLNQPLFFKKKKQQTTTTTTTQRKHYKVKKCYFFFKFEENLAFALFVTVRWSMRLAKCIISRY
jgi:hypothetical protein